MRSLNEWLATPSGLLVLAIGVGVVSGIGGVVLRLLVDGVTRAFTGHNDYGVDPSAIDPLIPGLGIGFLVIAPVLGGLLYGPLVNRFATEARGHGVPEVMLAVDRREGRIRPIVSAVKALAASLCIGSGGSVGREGPIILISSGLASTIGQWTRSSPSRMRVLVACGAAGGVSATFNAPLAGVFFAIEVILIADVAMRSLGAVLIAAVTADTLDRIVFGSDPFLTVPQLNVGPAGGYLLCIPLGILCALAGVALIRVLYAMEDRVDRIWRFSEAWRPAAGGLLLGLLLLALPQMYGTSHSVFTHAIEGRYAIAFLLVLLVGKIVATSLTLSIGGSGGVFAPSLFIGAMLGSAFGACAHDLLPGVSGPAGVYGMVAMGAVFAATARAPMTAILVVFELTGDYALILPAALAVVVSTTLASRLSPETIYTLKLLRQGFDIHARRPLDALVGSGE